MKKLLLAVSMVAFSASVFAQGTINVSSQIAPGLGRGTNATQSTGGAGPGYPLAGAGQLAQLYIGPAGTVDPLLLTTNATVGPVVFNATGFFTGGAAAVQGYGFGATITVQIRAWSAAFTSWEAAPDSERTKLSGQFAPNLVQVVLGGGGSPAAPPGNLTGLTPYVIGGVPEPSSIALGLLGLSAIALFRRRK